MKPKMTPRTHRRSPRKWRESFTVWIDFIGDRSQVGPLLDFIAGCPSDGGGTFVIGPPLSDQSWTVFSTSERYTLPPLRRDLSESAELKARKIFEKLQAACKTRWSPYIRLRLLHDDKPDRCEKPFVQTGPVKYFPQSKGGGHETPVRRGRGPLVLRKYQRGKLPKMPVRKMRTGKKGAA